MIMGRWIAATAFVLAGLLSLAAWGDDQCAAADDHGLSAPLYPDDPAGDDTVHCALPPHLGSLPTLVVFPAGSVEDRVTTPSSGSVRGQSARGPPLLLVS